MPHTRSRLALPRLQRKLKLFPVVAIQGARQTGKSFLARQLLRERIPNLQYLTFDQLSVKTDAQRSPQTFLETHSDSQLLVLDEAQKVPDVFDAIKFEVDQKRIPGRYLLLGSTEFSKLSQIRESLTGRMGRVRLFPLTFVESLGIESTPPTYERKLFLRYLQRGGMPGIFAIHEEDERLTLIQDWIDLICLRDLHQFKTLKLDSDLAYAILGLAATLEEPTQAQMARVLAVDPRKVGTHLKALSELFVLQKLNPHPSGTGKPIYLPLDPSIAGYLGASLIRKLHITLMNERLCKNSYLDSKRKTFYYYRSTGKKLIHWVEESIEEPLRAFQLIDHEKIKKTDSELMLSFMAKNQGSRGEVLSPIPEKQKIKNCSFVPWENMLIQPK